jgi:uncharacterized protein YggE
MMLRILCCNFLLIASLCAAHAADRLITVTGEGSVALAPDIAVIRIGVSTQGKTAADASNANAQKMAAVLGAIKDARIAERDVQTTALSLQPQYDSNKPGAAPRLVGFQASNQVAVKIRDIKELPDVIDRAISSGANEMSGIEFVVSEESKLLDQARGQAIADARRKADLYAQASGGHVGRVVSITEEGAPSPPRPMVSAMRAGAAVPVAPGEQTLKAAVTVSYMLEP